MKFYLFIFLLAFLGKCNNINNENLCVSLEKHNNDAVLKILSSNYPERGDYYTPREFLIRNNGVFDTLKTLEIYSTSAFNNDSTYSYFRYSDDYKLLEESKKVNGKKKYAYTYEYDDFGNLIKRNGERSSREWKYDKNQNLIENRSRNYKYFYRNEGLKVTTYTVRSIVDTSEYQSPFSEKVLNRYDEDTTSIQVVLYNEDGFHTYYETINFFPDGRFKKMTTEIFYDSLKRKSVDAFTNNIGISKNPTPQITEHFYNECGILKSTISYIKGIEETRDTTNYEYEILPSQNGQLKISTTVDSIRQTIKTYDEKGNWIHLSSYKRGKLTRERIRIIHYKD